MLGTPPQRGQRLRGYSPGLGTFHSCMDDSRVVNHGLGQMVLLEPLSREPVISPPVLWTHQLVCVKSAWWPKGRWWWRPWGKILGWGS